MRSPQDFTRFWCTDGLSGAEFSASVLAMRRYPPHAHEALAIGLVDAGIGRMMCRGAVHLAPRGSVFLIPRGEGHTGERFGTEPLCYRMIYVPVAVVERLGFREQSLREVTLSDRGIGAAVRWLHDASQQGASRLTLESAALQLLDRIYFRCGEGRSTRPSNVAHTRLERVREFLLVHATQPVSLAELARLGGCSPEHLVREFRRAYGLAPHQMQVSVRVELARRLLRKGAPPAEAARTAGFADQSHLTRHFRRQVGQTPAGYRRHCSPHVSTPCPS